MILRLLNLAIKGAVNATTETKPVLRYEKGIGRFDKAYFDSEYPYQFFKSPIQGLPADIAYYQSHIGHITLMKKQDTKQFEIYETNVISEKELAMNVRLSYADFVITGLNSRKNTVVTENHFFVFFINDALKQLEVKSSINHNITDKMIKSDFGEYLIKYLKKNFELEKSEKEDV